MGTKNNPGRYDCIAKAHDDEPMFTLLARDPLASSLVGLWARERELAIQRGEFPESDREKVKEAQECVVAMLDWRRHNPDKTNPKLKNWKGEEVDPAAG